MSCGIYGIFNVVNGKWYVGQSTDMPRRRQTHFSELRSGSHDVAHLQRSFVKYGPSAFHFCVLEEVGADLMDDRERWWISFYRSNVSEFGYNSEDGGRIGKQHSPETVAKMAAARLGKKHSAGTLLKMSRAQKGHLVSDETRSKISAALTGRKLGPQSPEHSAKISAANMGRVIGLKTRLAVAESNRRRKKLAQNNGGIPPKGIGHGQ